MARACFLPRASFSERPDRMGIAGNLENRTRDWRKLVVLRRMLEASLLQIRRRALCRKASQSRYNSLSSSRPGCTPAWYCCYVYRMKRWPQLGRWCRPGVAHRLVLAFRRRAAYMECDINPPPTALQQDGGVKARRRFFSRCPYSLLAETLQPLLMRRASHIGAASQILRRHRGVDVGIIRLWCSQQALPTYLGPVWNSRTDDLDIEPAFLHLARPASRPTPLDGW